MKKAYKKEFICLIGRLLLFIVIGVLLFITISRIFLEKDSYGKYRNYLNQDETTILILGSSHSAAGINADQLEMLISSDRKASVFNYSVYGMRIEQMAYFMQEILKNKDSMPKLIIIETYSFLPIADEHKEILARRAFDVFPLTRNKVEAISYLITEEDKWSYYIPFIKYHSRWKDLTDEDFEMLYNSKLWEHEGKDNNTIGAGMEEKDHYFEADTSQITEVEMLNATEIECIEMILAFAEENEINILFTSVPFKTQMGRDSLNQIKINNYISQEYVNDSNVKILDMNRMWQELDFGYQDLLDEGHCNEYGASKVTECIAEYILSNYDLSVITNSITERE